MNWIIRSTELLACHTNLTNLFKERWVNIDEYNWVISDIDYMTTGLPNFPLNLEDDYFILDSKQFTELVNFILK